MSTDPKIEVRRCACGGDAVLVIVDRGDETIVVVTDTSTLKSYRKFQVAAVNQCTRVIFTMMADDPRCFERIFSGNACDLLNMVRNGACLCA